MDSWKGSVAPPDKNPTHLSRPSLVDTSPRTYSLSHLRQNLSLSSSPLHFEYNSFLVFIKCHLVLKLFNPTERKYTLCEHRNQILLIFALATTSAMWPPLVQCLAQRRHSITVCLVESKINTFNFETLSKIWCSKFQSRTHGSFFRPAEERV